MCGQYAVFLVLNLAVHEPISRLWTGINVLHDTTKSTSPLARMQNFPADMTTALIWLQIGSADLPMFFTN